MMQMYIYIRTITQLCNQQHLQIHIGQIAMVTVIGYEGIHFKSIYPIKFF